MQRPYTLVDYQDLLKRLYRSIPSLAITTDIIVGFPGETEADHRQALDFVSSCGFAGIHVFPYSKRKGTPAADYPNQVSDQVKTQRVKEMLQVSRKSQKAYNASLLGHSVEVLVEHVDAQGKAFGHTENYLSVNLLPDINGEIWQVGQLVSVCLEKKHIAMINA